MLRNTEKYHDKPFSNPLEEVKNTLIDRFILFGSFLGFLIVIVSSAVNDEFSIDYNLVTDLISLSALLVVYAFKDRIHIYIKTSLVILFVFFLFINDIITYGVGSVDHILIVFIPFLSMLVFSIRTTVIIFIVAMIAYSAVAYAHLNDILTTDAVDPSWNTLSAWINSISTSAVVAIVLTVFVHIYNEKSDTFIQFLEEQNDELLKRDEMLEASIYEKNVMIQEIHHRVKNNLAVVSGLLDLQSQKIENPDLQFILSKSTNRVMSIAKVHEKLYETTDFRNIPFDSYIKELAKIIMASMKKDEKVIDFVFNVNVESLGINHGVPLGIIFNELITNSIKYGFHDEVDNIISISLLQENGSIHASYYDNGIGIKDFDETSNKSLGFTLIHSLFNQIDATFNYDTDGQFKLEFSFPIDSDSGPYEKDKVLKA